MIRVYPNLSDLIRVKPEFFQVHTVNTSWTGHYSGQSHHRFKTPPSTMAFFRAPEAHTPHIKTTASCRVDWFLPVLLLQFVFTLPSDFAEDAALLQYCTSCYQAPLRTVLALFTHTAPHMVIYRALNMLTMILGFGSGNSFNMLENSSQFRQPRLPRRLSHL